MSVTAIDPTHHSELLHRVFDLPRQGLTSDRARWLLSLDFPDADQARIEVLNDKANEGTLTDDERAELHAYVNVADLLAYWHSQARQHLGQNAGSSDCQ